VVAIAGPAAPTNRAALPHQIPDWCPCRRLLRRWRFSRCRPCWLSGQTAGEDPLGPPTDAMLPRRPLLIWSSRIDDWPLDGTRPPPGIGPHSLVQLGPKEPLRLSDRPATAWPRALAPDDGPHLQARQATGSVSYAAKPWGEGGEIRLVRFRQVRLHRAAVNPGRNYPSRASAQLISAIPFA